MIDPRAKALGLNVRVPPSREQAPAPEEAVEVAATHMPAKPEPAAVLTTHPAPQPAKVAAVVAPVAIVAAEPAEAAETPAQPMRRTRKARGALAAAQLAAQESIERPVNEIVTVDAKPVSPSNVIWEPMPEITAAILSHENARLNETGDKLSIDVCITCRSTEKAHYCTELKKGRRLLWTKDQGLNATLWNTLKESARVGKIIREARDKANQVPDPYPLFPAELKTLERFGLYRLVWNDKAKKNDKPPYNARAHMKGNPIDETQRSSYEIVSKVLSTDTRYQGAGFGLQYSDGYTCTDFDHCVDPAGMIEPRVQQILSETNSYAEFSPSGDGIHVWTKGYQVPKVGDTEGRKVGNAEMYSGRHYMTVTGKHVPGTPLTIESRDLSGLYARICAGEFVVVKQPASAQVSTLTASAIPAAQQDKRRVVNDGTSSHTTTALELFMNGEIDTSHGFTVCDKHGNSIQPPYDSQNGADLALVNILMVKHKGDESLVDDDFQQSILTRDKWEKRADYRELTFKKARESYEKHKAREASKAAMATTDGALIADSEESDYDEELDDAQEPLPEFPKMTGSLADLCHAICPDIPFEFKFAVALAYFGLFVAALMYSPQNRSCKPASTCH